MALFQFAVPALDIQLTFDILKSLAEQTEISIQGNIDRFINDGVQTFEIEIDAEEGIYQSIDTYLGLVDHDVVLDYIFKSYFPSLQRRSVFLTIFGTMEHELAKFCNSYSKRNNFSIALNDLRGQGLEQTHLYMMRILNLNNSQFFPIIRKIIKLRNSCIHNDCRFVTVDGQEISAICLLMKEYPDVFTKDGKQVLFLKNSLTLIISIFQQYVSEIEAAVKQVPPLPHAP
ncbi:hypothetical protein SME24J_09470 [Serratia marcescens]|nr:hypothetical protein SME24J_09470 [Serratia marcescens]